MKLTEKEIERKAIIETSKLLLVFILSFSLVVSICYFFPFAIIYVVMAVLAIFGLSFTWLVLFVGVEQDIRDKNS